MDELNRPVPRSLADAQAALAAGKPEEAERLLGELLHAEPNRPDAVFALGTLVLRRGDSVGAAQLFDRVLTLAPSHPMALLLRGKIAKDSREITRAHELAQLLVEHADGRSEMLFEAGQIFFAQDSFRYAARCFDQVWRGHPKEGEAGYWLAKSLVALGRPLEARRILQSIAPFAGHKNPHLALAEICLEFGDTADAKESCRAALLLDPKDDLSHILLARALTVEQDLEGASREWLVARELSESPARVLTTQAYILQSQGDFEGALGAFRAAVETDPQDGYGYSMIAQAHKVTATETPWVEETGQRLQTLELSDDSKRHFNFALGKSYHDLREYELAWKHYAEGNRLLRKVLYNDAVYDSQQHRSLVDGMMATFTPELFQRIPKLSQSESPIFVLGMIRSGTTLVEQIISSHHEVSGAGELTFWQMNWQSFLDVESRSLDLGQLEIAGKDYIELLQAYGRGSKRVTDKNPANYMGAGLIHAALPKAKIVCVRRKPIDTAMSIWMTAMRTDAGYQGDQAGIVSALQQSQRMNDYWASVLPRETFHTVVYEELISDRERVTRELIDFLGIAWDERCLSPQSNVRDVLTPSFWQVRQAVYSSSVDRWKPYEPWLGVFRELL